MTKVLLKDVIVRIKDKVDKDKTDLEFYVGGEHFDNGAIRITKRGIIKGSTIGPAFIMHFMPGDVLLMSRNPHLRKAGVVDFEGICSDVSYVCRTCDESVLMQRFLPFLFQTDEFWNFAEANKKGSTNFFLNWSDFERYELELPDHDMQEKLVELLWIAENALEAEANELQKAIDLRNSLYNEMQSEEYFVQHCLKYKIGAIGENYQIENNLRKPISQAERSTMQGEYPYWGPTGILDYLNEFRIDGLYALIGEDGDHFLKYRTWDMTHLVNGKFNVNNHAHVICGKYDNLIKWFFYYFKHRNITNFLTKQGGGRMKLTKATLQTMPIIIPETEVQTSLCETFDKMEDMIHKIEEQIQSTRDLIKSLIACNI